MRAPPHRSRLGWTDRRLRRLRGAGSSRLPPCVVSRRVPEIEPRATTATTNTTISNGHAFAICPIATIGTTPPPPTGTGLQSSPRNRKGSVAGTTSREWSMASCPRQCKRRAAVPRANAGPAIGGSALHFQRHAVTTRTTAWIGWLGRTSETTVSGDFSLQRPSAAPRQGPRSG